jgi:hypothetical protein
MSTYIYPTHSLKSLKGLLLRSWGPCGFPKISKNRLKLAPDKPQEMLGMDQDSPRDVQDGQRKVQGVLRKAQGNQI